jgi:uncharacterized membrane protein
MKTSTYEKIFYLCRRSGCHQKSERSFHIHNKQFPVCARCCGVLAGHIIAYVLFLFYNPPVHFCILGCTVIFADWLVQYLGIKESTNIRRLITGIIGGYSLATIYCLAIKFAIRLLI